MLTLVRSLDFEKQRLHKLIISAYDGIDKSNALNGTSEVNIVVRNLNEFHPEFVNTSDVFYINVEEGKLISRLYQVKCFQTYRCMYLMNIKAIAHCIPSLLQKMEIMIPLPL